MVAIEVNRVSGLFADNDECNIVIRFSKSLVFVSPNYSTPSNARRAVRTLMSIMSSEHEVPIIDNTRKGKK